MTSRRKAAHVGANLGEEDLDRGLAQARNLLQSFNGVTKGLKRGLDPPIEGRDRLFQLLNGLQVLLDEEAVMWAHATEQRIGKLRLRCGEPRTAKLGQLQGVGLASHDGLQDAPPTGTQDVGDDRRELDIGFLEHGLDALGVLHDLARELLPGPRQIAQLLDRLRWYETRPDQTVR